MVIPASIWVSCNVAICKGPQNLVHFLMYLFFEYGLQEITNICVPFVNANGTDFMENSGKWRSNLFLKVIVG